MLTTVLQYHAAGWRVFPVRVAPKEGGGHTKRPLVAWEEFQDRSPTEQEVRAWWTTWPDADVGLALGKGSGIIRMDCDGAGAVKELEALGSCPETAEFTTVGGGRGYLLQWEAWVSTAVLWRGTTQHEELRVQSEGAYTVVPPTPGYAWIRQTPIARAPRWMLSWYAEKALRETPSAVIRCDLKDSELREALSKISPDDYDTWVKVGMALHGRDAFALWEEWSAGSAKFKPGECAKKWETFNGAGITIATVIHLAKEAGWRPVWSPYEPLTEGGNANVLARTAEGRAMFSPTLGWLAWDSRKWTTGQEAECLVGEMQRDSLRLRRGGVAASLVRLQGVTPEVVERRRAKVKTLSKIDQLDKATCYHGTRKIARGAMLCDWSTFNAKPTLLNFKNGTVDLVTGQIRPHNSDDRLTTMVPHEFDAKAECPAFHAFFERSLPDPDIRRYLHLKLGSTLLGETRKELLILWGPEGDNGKTMLVELMLAALGPCYSTKCANGLLLQRNVGDDDRNTVMLFGVRFAACSETNEGAKLNEALLKELTGGDKITSRYLFKEKFSFEPTHDILYVTNHKPVLHGTDDALWNRIKLVEFSKSFPSGHPERVEGLGQLLKAEIPGFTSWLVRGCVEYYRTRTIVQPEAVLQSSADYRKEHNPVAKFLEERKLIKTDGVERKTLKGKVVEMYKSWCRSGAPFNATWFGKMMGKLGVGSDKNYYFVAESVSSVGSGDEAK